MKLGKRSEGEFGAVAMMAEICKKEIKMHSMRNIVRMLFNGKMLAFSAMGETGKGFSDGA